ncbi:response regulator transcription factor [Limnochorda pilosa]|uniref:Transcriptional regulator n=1 Tax=Limnochorda pilosa TaxID=1555112 RepID=A0A0K2SPL7_LIMPI|nr:response regulator transcription factor [Limnochorda pilosa]BAS28764.1 transcriptional regulator [Limnochorda pilosa]
MEARLLIVEDDAASRSLLQRYLTAKGHTVEVAPDGRQALERYVAFEPDLVLLDCMLPERDGWEVLQELRRLGQTPVIMVTVRDSTSDKVKGLSLGADDYVTKPFDLQEIAARIEAVLRRTGASGEHVYRCGDIVVDDERKLVEVAGRKVELSPKEYELLTLLISRPGRVFSSEEILNRIWPGKPYTSGEDAKKYIHFLRNKLEEDPEHPTRILTIRGFGYKLAEAAAQEEAPA